MRRELTLSHGIALALGSIAGSGLLFLPSLTLSIGGGDVLLIWLAATVVCLPILFLFMDVAREFADGRGVEGLIAKGLGPDAAAGVPILFLAIVVIGIPAGALIAGSYVAGALGGGRAAQVGTALAIVGLAAASNLAGVRTGARVQTITAAALIVMAGGLVALTVPDASGGYDAVAPTFDSLGPILPGLLVAFWAYAGFENLTFIAGEFKNPRRDFPIAMVVAFVAYGLLAVALTANLGAVVPASELDEVAGLAQLAAAIEPSGLSTAVTAALALALLQVQANSWVWGMSRLVHTSASDGRLPASLGRLDGRGVPRRAILLLGASFAAVIALSLPFPGLVTDLVVLGSAGFVVIYVLAVAAYLRGARGMGRRALARALLAVLMVMLASAGLRSLYALGVLSLAVAARRRRRRPRRATPPRWSAGRRRQRAA